MHKNSNKRRDYEVTLLTPQKAHDRHFGSVLIFNITLPRKVSPHDRFKEETLLTQELSEVINRMDTSENKNRLRTLLNVIELIKAEDCTIVHTQVTWRKKILMVAFTFQNMGEAINMFIKIISMFGDECIWNAI